MIIFTWHKNSTRMSLVACHTSSAITLVKTGTGSRKKALTSLSDANTTSFVELTYLKAGVALTQRDTYSVLNMFVGDCKQQATPQGHRGINYLRLVGSFVLILLILLYSNRTETSTLPSWNTVVSIAASWLIMSRVPLCM